MLEFLKNCLIILVLFFISILIERNELWLSRSNAGHLNFSLSLPLFGEKMKIPWDVDPSSIDYFEIAVRTIFIPKPNKPHENLFQTDVLNTGLRVEFTPNREIAILVPSNIA